MVFLKDMGEMDWHEITQKKKTKHEPGAYFLGISDVI